MMNKIVGTASVATAVVVAIFMLTLLPEITVGHESVQPFERYYGVQPEPTTVPIPWSIGSLAAIIAGWFLVGPSVRVLERHDRRLRGEGQPLVEDGLILARIAMVCIVVLEVIGLLSVYQLAAMR